MAPKYRLTILKLTGHCNINILLMQTIAINTLIVDACFRTLLINAYRVYPKNVNRHSMFA